MTTEEEVKDKAPEAKPVESKPAPSAESPVRTPESSEGPASKPVKKTGPVEAVAHVRSTFNNTIVTISDPGGQVVCWSSAGLVGFKGDRKGTPYAASVASEDAGRKAQDRGVKRVKVQVRGPGAGREAAIRGLQTSGLEITLIRDVTPIPHNGCRPPKRRRV